MIVEAVLRMEGSMVARGAGEGDGVLLLSLGAVKFSSHNTGAY